MSDNTQALQVFTFESHETRVIMIDGDPWWIASEVCKVLGLANVSQAVGKLDEDEKLIQAIVSSGQGRKVWFVNQKGLKKLVTGSRKPSAIEIARHLAIEVNGFYCSKEQRTLFIIISAFKHILHTTQYKAGPYRIDLYFFEHKIAVECDESGHQCYDTKKEAERQTYLENMLGCTFVRFNPDAPNFNIGETINEIMRLIYK